MATLQLTHWQRSYAPQIARLANDPGIAANLRDAFPHPYTLADAQGFIAACMAAGPGQLLLAILVDGQPAGSISLCQGQDIYRQSAELGYWLGRPYWGRGIMTQAVSQICSLGFSQLPIRRIFAEPFARNLASRRAAAGASVFQCQMTVLWAASLSYTPRASRVAEPPKPTVLPSMAPSR